jgi:hypothetical protein
MAKPIRLLTSLVVLAFGVVVGVVTAVVALWYIQFGAQVAPSITANKLLTIRPGQTTQQLLNCCGAPLHQYSPALERGDFRPSSRMVWVYATASPFESGFEIEVAVEDDKVVRVSVEHYDLLVYSCTESRCPEIIDVRAMRRLENALR